MTNQSKLSDKKIEQKNSAVIGVVENQKQWVDYATPYFPLILTIIGWWVVSRQNDHRERRKEIRELIKQVELRVETIIATTNDYYMLDGKNAKCPELASKIRYNISALDPLRKRIKSAGLECDVVGEIVIFKQSVTGDQFESPNRPKLPAGHAKMSEAATAGFALVDKFETSYFANFPMKKSWFLKAKS